MKEPKLCRSRIERDVAPLPKKQPDLPATTCTSANIELLHLATPFAFTKYNFEKTCSHSRRTLQIGVCPGVLCLCVMSEVWQVPWCRLCSC